MGRTFRARLFALHLAVVAVTLGVVGITLTILVRDTLFESTVDSLSGYARLIAARLPGDADRLQAFVTDLRVELGDRVTLVADDGRVLADSHTDPALLGNHAGRPEIEAARAGGVGVARRPSESIGTPLLYVAVRVDPAGRTDGADGGPPVRFVRIARPLGRVDTGLGRVGLLLGIGLLLGGALGLAAALVASRALRERAGALATFAAAVSRGAVSSPPRGRLGAADDELGGLEQHLAATACDLRAYVAALAEQRRRIEAIVGSMDEGVIVATRTGEVLLMNRVAEHLLGVEPAAWQGRELLELTRHPDLHALLEQAAAGDGRAAGEIRFTVPREQDLAVSVAPLRGGPDAEPAGAAPGERSALGHVVVLRDVTRLKKLERMRTDFVANVSHELKTPLAAIRASLETLADWALEDPEGARRYVVICLSHAERLQRLIDDLLALSNIELGQVRLSLQPVDLAAAVDETFELLAAKAEARGVRLAKAVPAGFPPLLVDRNRLLQILLNLVDNAIKFTPGGGSVTVSGQPAQGPGAAGSPGLATDPAASPATGAGPAAGEAAGPAAGNDQPPAAPARWGVVAVADTGIGIPRADLPRIGERFYRADKARSREAGGTGLGLAIVKHLVQLHGGRLEITSEVGRGTTVRVALPHAAQKTATGHVL